MKMKNKKLKTRLEIENDIIAAYDAAAAAYAAYDVACGDARTAGSRAQDAARAARDATDALDKFLDKEECKNFKEEEND